MTYLEILTDICSRVADPELDTYKDRAKDHFLRAITTETNRLLADDKNAEVIQNIPGFVKTKTTMTFNGGTEDINSLKVFAILGFFLPPGTDKDVVITYQDVPELNRISMIETLQPSIYDVFIWRDGNTLNAYNHATPEFVFNTDNMYMQYIEDIDDANWTDATDLQSASDFQLTYTFMRTCIELASQTLLDEVKL